MSRAAPTAALFVSLLAGCGLSLDLDPPGQSGGGGMDGGGVFDGSASDGARPDGGADAGPECEENSDCFDGNPCNGLESCTVGGCADGIPPTCDDMIDCTDDSCDEEIGCKHIANDDLCDRVPGGFCDVATRGCQYPSCEVGVTCTGSECETVTCEGTTCMRTPRCADGELCCGGTCFAMDCDDNPCTSDACGTDGCVSTPIAVGCDDGDPCTRADTCVGGVCTAGRGCGDDPTDCLDESCEPGVGCRSEILADLTGCDDRNPCTSGEQCFSGLCTGGFATTCADDGNPCTRDDCDPVLGPCGSPLPDGTHCEDLDACTSGDACTMGLCVPGTSLCPATIPICNHGDCSSGTCVITRDPDGTPCGLNRACSGGSCVCAGGWNDCNGDRVCECNGLCEGAGRCGVETSCVESGCSDGELCCPCTGRCYAPGCLSCCMVCDPCARVTCRAGEECCCDGTCAATGTCAAPCTRS